jgi:hypothetical protein
MSPRYQRKRSKKAIEKGKNKHKIVQSSPKSKELESDSKFLSLKKRRWVDEFTHSHSSLKRKRIFVD